MEGIGGEAWCQDLDLDCDGTCMYICTSASDQYVLCEVHLYDAALSSCSLVQGKRASVTSLRMLRLPHNITKTACQAHAAQARQSCNLLAYTHHGQAQSLPVLCHSLYTCNINDDDDAQLPICTNIQQD